MESVAEHKSDRIELDAETDTREEAPLTVQKQQAKRIYRAPARIFQYAQSLGGLVAIVTLLIVPMLTIPGMIIAVLLAEVYLIDWTYSKFSQLRNARSSVTSESSEKSPENEIDRKVARTSPKDQFVK